MGRSQTGGKGGAGIFPALWFPTINKCPPVQVCGDPRGTKNLGGGSGQQCLLALPLFCASPCMERGDHSPAPASTQRK